MIRKSDHSCHWLNDEVATTCDGCLRGFTFKLRRHHCRDCGGIFCSACASNKLVMPHRGFPTKKVRVCDLCAKFISAHLLNAHEEVQTRIQGGGGGGGNTMIVSSVKHSASPDDLIRTGAALTRVMRKCDETLVNCNPENENDVAIWQMNCEGNNADGKQYWAKRNEDAGGQLFRGVDDQPHSAVTNSSLKKRPSNLLMSKSVANISLSASTSITAPMSKGPVKSAGSQLDPSSARPVPYTRGNATKASACDFPAAHHSCTTAQEAGAFVASLLGTSQLSSQRTTATSQDSSNSVGLQLPSSSGGLLSVKGAAMISDPPLFTKLQNDATSAVKIAHSSSPPVCNLVVNITPY